MEQKPVTIFLQIPCSKKLWGWENLKQGEALAILSAKDNPQYKIIILDKYATINSINEIEKIVGTDFKSPVAIPEGFIFKEGRVSYGVNEIIKKEMIDESKYSDKSLIVRGLKDSNKTTGYDLTYSFDDIYKNMF